MKQIARALLREIRVDGGISSLDTMGVPMVVGAQGRLALGAVPRQSERRRGHDYPARYRQINGGSYDLVVGNPPYVRAHRRTRDALMADYEPVATGQFDLYVPFVFRALKAWLKPGGRMGLVVPMAVLDAGYAKGLREVLNDYRLVEIVDLELLRKKTFHGVKRPTVILILENSAPVDDEEVKITTVSMEAYDPVTDIINMGAAVSEIMPRDVLRQTRWLPQAFIPDQEWQKLIEFAVGSSSELTTKVKQEDLPVLTKLAAVPRIAEHVQRIWVNRRNDDDFRLSITDAEIKQYEQRLLFQYGLKLGGTAALSRVGNQQIYKALNIFPGGLLGDSVGYWNRGGEQEIRIYRYESVLDHSRLFASREICQMPTIARVPDGAVFQNTANLCQLYTDLPVNVWVVSRVLQFYCAKVLRASIVEDITAHWYKKQFLLMPAPIAMSDDLASRLSYAGERLFAADRRIADEYRYLDELVERGSLPLRGLIAEDAELTRGIDLRDVPQDSVLIDSVRIEGDGILTSSQELMLVVPNDDLRCWLAHQIERKLEDGAIEISRADMLGESVPNDLAAVIAELNRLRTSSPEEAFETALADLDQIVGVALGLDVEDLAYIQRQMREDPFLKLVSPVWEKRGLSAQRYSPRETNDEDD